MHSSNDLPSNSTPSRPLQLLRLASPWLTPLVLLAGGFLFQRLAGAAPVLVDRYYSQTLYFYIARGITQISRPFSFSLAELLLFTLPLAGLALVIVRTKREVRARTPMREIFSRRTRELFWFAAIFFNLFLLLFGLNYQRQSLAAHFTFDNRAPTTTELETIATHIIVELNRNFADAGGTILGSKKSLSVIDPAQLASIETSFQATALLGSARAGGFGAPKPVVFSRLLSKIGISGIYSPFTGEPNFNVDQPADERPFSIAHEKGHQRGFAREDEANFVAFLVCSKASDPFVRYSGFLRGLRVLAPLQAMTTPERYRDIISRLSPGVRADLRNGAEYWQRMRSQRLGAVAERANDTYLRANRVSSGIRNYGEVVTLIIGYYLTYPPQ